MMTKKSEKRISRYYQIYHTALLDFYRTLYVYIAMLEPGDAFVSQRRDGFCTCPVDFSALHGKDQPSVYYTSVFVVHHQCSSIGPSL